MDVLREWWLLVLAAGLLGIAARAFFTQAGRDAYDRLAKYLFPASTRDQATSPIEHVSRLTYREIFEKIEAAPPLQRSRLRDDFRGLRVAWDATMYSGEVIRGAMELNLRIPDSGGAIGLVTCSVPRESHPELMVLSTGHLLRVEGDIASVEPSTLVTLKKVRLDVL